MKASLDLLAVSESGVAAGSGQTGHATPPLLDNLSRMGEGQPLILVPGLAGRLELLDCWARPRQCHFRVIIINLRRRRSFALRQRFDLVDLVKDLTSSSPFRGWSAMMRASPSAA